MIKVLHRGKAIHNNEWYYGSYFAHETRQVAPLGEDRLKEDEIKHLIIQDSFADWNMPKTIQVVDVDPETVGRFTGKYIENHKRVFEGDIIKFWNGYGHFTAYVYYDDFFAMFCVKKIQGTTDSSCGDELGKMYDYHKKLIGNIFDNPELLEVTEK